jgi:hypothetical protein
MCQNLGQVVRSTRIQLRIDTATGIVPPSPQNGTKAERWLGNSRLVSSQARHSRIQRAGLVSYNSTGA